MKAKHDYVATSLSITTKRVAAAAVLVAVVAGSSAATVTTAKVRHDTNGMHREAGVATK